MAGTLDQFITFTTDSVGIERILRLFQALSQVFASCALPFELLLAFLTFCTGHDQSPELTLAILVTLKSRLNLARRFFRVFRFIETFRDAQRLYSSVQSSASQQKNGGKTGGVGADVWLDIFAKTFNGMYLLLETSTMIDALDIPGFAVWDVATRININVEAQRFWLFGLVCGLLSNLWKMVGIMALAPVPQSVATEKLAAEGDGNEKKSLKDEQARLKKAQMDREMVKKEASTKIYKLGRGAVANAFDITIPGTVVGWLPLDDGTVGSCMVVSTILTGLAVWEGCA